MTTWLGLPIVGTAKYTIPVSENINLAIGGLAGSFTWVDLNTGFLLPYASLTFGDRRRNITFSGGYGAVFIDGEGEGRFLMSVSGLYKTSDNFSLVLDSFIIPNIIDGDFGGGLIVPGVRWNYNNKGALQFGFAGLASNEGVAPFLIPMIQWFFNLK